MRPSRAALWRIAAAVSSALCAWPAAAQTYYWSAFVGLPPQIGTADGVGTNARFTFPVGLNSSAGGTTYVCDTSNHTIRHIAPDRTVSTLAGLPGVSGSNDGIGTAARFSAPRGATLARGMLYVADTNNHVIRQISPPASVTTFAGASGAAGTADGAGANARFNRPAAIDTDSAGNLYVADTGNHAIRKITPEREVSTFAGVPGSPGAEDGPAARARFNGPAALYVSGSGVVYVCDTQNHTVRRIGTDGAVTTIAGSAGVQGAVNGVGAAARFRFPLGLVAYADGSILVSDEAHAIRLITPAGSVSTYAGRLGVQGSRDGSLSEARFYVPAAMRFHPDGVVIADMFNHSIRLLSVPRRDVTTLAGSTGNFGRNDGVGPEARFNQPNGVAVHPSGDIYLADSAGNSIRRILPDGQVIRVAGQPEGDAYVDGPAPVQSLNFPHGLAVAADRTVYFCERMQHTVRVLRPDGSVATLAGQEGSAGAINGAGTAARFNRPAGLALDRAGNIYLADTDNHLIRRIAAGTNMVTMFAGVAGSAGAEDGAAGARFNSPRAVAVDAQDNVYVADGLNATIRKITPDGTVSTLAGLAGTLGSANGSGSEARFRLPYSIAVDREGTLYVADSSNDTIRKIVGNTVSTIGGITQGTGFREAAGTAAIFHNPSGIAVDANGTIYVSEAGSNIVRRGDIMGRPAITAEPASQALPAGGTATLSVSATGAGLRYQWQRNGVMIPGATTASYTIANATAAAAGEYKVTVTNSLGSIASANANLTLAPGSNAGRLVNLSILSALTAPGDAFILGFVVGGGGTAGSKPLLIRAAGPSLAPLGVADTLADPQLELFSGTTKAGENDNWRGRIDLAAAMRDVGAFAFASIDSLDAAATRHFERGNNSVRVSGVGSGTGSVIAEIYDATPAAAFTTATPRLINVSVLKHIGTGLVAGFAIGGGEPKKVLIRAVGPTLGSDPFAVEGVVADPQLTLFSGQTPIGSNDDWRGASDLGAAFVAVGAFPLPASSRDAALLATLNPGPYTVQVMGVAGSTGVALVEIYEVP